MTRIGMIAPITHPYPPPGYGPWERVTHDLTERLVTLGHQVTLFAPAGSVTKAEHVVTASAPLRLLPPEDGRAVEDAHLATAIAMAAEGRFDVVHSHLHVHALPFAESIPCPLLTTLHGAAWNPGNHAVLRRHAHLPFVSLSDREREFLPELNYVATIPNGIRMEDFPVGMGSEGYLAFVGRLSPEKAPHLAVEVARRTGHKLVMAGIIEDQYAGYARGVLDEAEGTADYLGALDRRELNTVLQGALGLLMPLQWDEPFGLVVVESLASGTPVVAWRRGAMPEILEDGVTGFLVEDVEGAVAAVARLPGISREVCAGRARDRFDDGAMARAYAAVYEALASTPSPRSALPSG